jgi:hypothetical protein
MRQVYTSCTELRNSLDNATCAVKPARRRPPSGYEVEAPPGLMIQRFLRQADPKAALLRLFQADAPFVIGDPTEMPRPQARKTSYVGTLKDGTTRGFWLLLLATPYRPKACAFSTPESWALLLNSSSRYLSELESEAQLGKVAESFVCL